MIVYVATFSSSNDCGSQKVFANKKKAEDWLYKTWKKNFQDDIDQVDGEQSEQSLFKEWCRHGTWTCKVKKHLIN